MKNSMRVIERNDGGRVVYGFDSLRGGFGSVAAGVWQYDEFGRIVRSDGRTFASMAAARRVYSLRGLRSIACAWAR